MCTFSDNLFQNSCITIEIDDITSGTEDSQSHMQLKCECVKKVSMELLNNTFQLFVVRAFHLTSAHQRNSLICYLFTKNT